jgi:hypothetical protein
MGKVLIIGTGGAVIGSDDCTALKTDVLKGTLAVTADSDDELIEGTLELTGDASDNQVLAGKTYYNTNPKNKRSGSAINHGAISVKLSTGESYIVPSGFHNGGGKVEANGLASQTQATANAEHILSGYDAWVNGNKITGKMSIQSILSFNAAVYSSTALSFTWQNPAKGPFSGVIIVGKTGSYPTSISDGIRYYIGYGNNLAANANSTATISGFAGGNTYYFRAFSYVMRNNAEWVHSTSYTVRASIEKGLQTFTSSGTFTVPSNVRNVTVFLVGGGGGGGGGGAYPYPSGGGGGGAGYTVTKAISVTPGQQIAVTIGGGGNGAAGRYKNVGYSGSAGGITYFGSIAATGGSGGEGGGTSYSGGNGGSGGGGGGDYIARGNSDAGGAGGANGSKGFGSLGNINTGGFGQGTSTFAFGESSNILYAGGGGGGGSSQSSVIEGGSGANGGGGSGGYSYGTSSGGNGNNGTTNTGSGGGGGGGTRSSSSSGGAGGNGGSGICIVRWGY